MKPMLESIAPPTPAAKDFARIPKETLLMLLAVAGYQAAVVTVQLDVVEGMGVRLDTGLAAAMVVFALIGFKKPVLGATLGFFVYAAVLFAHAFNNIAIVFDFWYTRIFAGFVLFGLWRRVSLYRHLKTGADALARSPSAKK